MLIPGRTLLHAAHLARRWPCDVRSSLTSVQASQDVPPLPPYGSHHSKGFLVWRQSLTTGRLSLRVVVTTANFIHSDVCAKSNGLCTFLVPDFEEGGSSAASSSSTTPPPPPTTTPPPTRRRPPRARAGGADGEGETARHCGLRCPGGGDGPQRGWCLPGGEGAVQALVAKKPWLGTFSGCLIHQPACVRLRLYPIPEKLIYPNSTLASLAHQAPSPRSSSSIPSCALATARRTSARPSRSTSA